MQWLADLLMLFFPSNCLACGKRLHAPGEILCFVCELKMPGTWAEGPDPDPVSKIFWGRVRIMAGISLFKFEKGSVYQALLHDLKYRDNRRAGYYLGSLLGHKIRRSAFSDCDLLVPVPLHRRREYRRGYNQSEVIACGVSQITGIPLRSGLIRRKRNARSQTTMNRQDRFENMATAFTLQKNPPDLNGKRILIIDDIITTGATLEACARVLLEHFNCQVFVATVSYA